MKVEEVGTGSVRGEGGRGGGESGAQRGYEGKTLFPLLLMRIDSS